MATTLWKIPFQAVNGDDYRVEIKVEVGTGTAATLIGGASPIVTEEDDDDDLFLPVRTQSGYIQFVDDGSNLGAVMPSSSTDRMVMLYKRTGPYFPGDPTGWTGELVWKGYLQPQSFSGEYLRSPQIRELPICCPLSVLDSWDVEVGVSSGFANFAAILYYIFSKLGTADPSSSDEGYWLAFQGGLQVTEWLSKRVSWDSLGGEDEEGNAEAKYTCLELLEHVCRFFGWICRIDGKTVWFTCPDYATGNFRRMTLSQLYSIANGTYPQTQEVGWSSLYLFDNINVFASRRNTETLVRGIRKATVVAEVDAYDTLLELPFDKIAKAIRDGNVYRSQYRQAQPASGDDPAIEPGFFYWRYVPYFAGRRFGNIRLTTNQGNSAGSDAHHFQARIDDYEFYEGGVMDKHNYAMTTDLYIVGMAGKAQTTPVVINEQMPGLIINDDDAINQREGWIIGDNITPDTIGQVTITTNALAIIETVNSVVLSGGVLVLSGTLQTDYIRGVGHVAVTPNGTLSIRVSIGNNYYIYQGDGDGYWNTNPDATTKETDCWLDVPVRDGAIATTRVLTAPYPAYEGFGMLVHEVGGRMADISGALKIEIRGWEPKGESTISGTIYNRDDEGASLAPSSSAIHYDGSDVNVHITSLFMKFLRHKDHMANADRNQNKYTAAGSNLFRDTKTEHVIWYTDNKNAYGKGILTNTDGSYPTTLIFGSANDRPEQHLANRIATYYGIPRKQYRLDLLMSVLAAPAPNMYLKIYGNITTYPVALKRDWRDGVMGVTALAIAGSGNHAPNDPDYPQEEAVSVTLHLKNVYVDGSYPDVVLAGETMEAALVADEGYRISSVVITVGGEDTEDLYDEATGVVHIENVWGNVVIDAVAEEIQIIEFEDDAVKAICVANWGGNVVAGEITVQEAADVTSIGTTFRNNTTITKFNELRYFTCITSLYNSFFGCTNLLEVELPRAAFTSLRNAFYGCTKLSKCDIPNDMSWTFASDGLACAFYNTGALACAIDLSSVKGRASTYVSMTQCFQSSGVTSVIMPRTTVLLDSCLARMKNLVSVDTNGMTVTATGNKRLNNIIGANASTTVSNALTTITHGFNGANINLDLGYAPLTHDSAVAVINGLATVGTTQTLTFSSSTMTTLSDAEKAVATGKGWALAEKG